MVDSKTLKAREFVSEVMRLANEYELNCFVVTDGASGITNTDNPAVEHARKCHTEWEVKNGIDPEHDWSKDEEQQMISSGYSAEIFIEYIYIQVSERL